MGACERAYRTYSETCATAATSATVYKNQQLNKLSAATGATGVKGRNFPAVFSLARGTRERNFVELKILKEVRRERVDETGSLNTLLVYSFLCGQCDQVHVGIGLDVGSMRTELRVMDTEARLLQNALDECLEVEPEREVL